MKATTTTHVLPGTQIAATTRLASNGEFELGLRSHRAVIEQIMSEFNFGEDAQATLHGLEDVHQKLAGKTRRQGVIVVPAQLIIVRSAGSHGIANPFDRRFPARWTTTYLGPDFAVKHLSVYEWLDIQDQLTENQRVQFQGVWCGTRQFKHADGLKTTVFRFDGGKAQPVELDINPAPEGAVAFGVDRVIDTQD